ncbi:hypothetical protein Syun_012761 [Stephania yunnanensis]|uniref:Uncharacterized protein n=1 Tax=Stephania yunnanensis TaxID=152371 RepID=A0AAP0K038_9MAGN
MHRHLLHRHSHRRPPLRVADSRRRPPFTAADSVDPTPPPLRRGKDRRRHPHLLLRARLPKVITHLRNSSIPILPGLSDSEFVRAEPSLASPSLPTSAPYSQSASPSPRLPRLARPHRLPPPTPRLPRPPHLHHLLHGYTSKATYPNQIWPRDLNRRKGEAGRKGGGGWPAVDDDAALSMVGAHCAREVVAEETRNSVKEELGASSGGGGAGPEQRWRRIAEASIVGGTLGRGAVVVASGGGNVGATAKLDGTRSGKKKGAISDAGRENREAAAAPDDNLA